MKCLSVANLYQFIVYDFRQAIALIGNPPSDKDIGKIVKATTTWLNAYFFEPQNIRSVPLPTFCTISEGGNNLAYGDFIHLSDIVISFYQFDYLFQASSMIRCS